MATGSQLQPGRSMLPDSTSFLAYPSWEGESLAFTPWPKAEVQQSLPHTVPQGLAEAVRHQRTAFREIATGWVTEFRQSPDAQEAVAIALGLSGDRAAIDALQRARLLAREPEDRLRLAASEVWARIKFSIPTDVEDIQAARAMADSLLEARDRQHPLQPRMLASLAALTGRAELAASLSSDARVVDEWGLEPALAQAPVPAFFVFASLGGPCDTLRTLEQAVARSIERSASPSERIGLSLFALAYPASFAFPDCQLGSITTLAGHGDKLINAQDAILRGDTAGVRANLTDIQDSRANARQLPEILTLDALYPEAQLIARIGDRQAAIRWLDPTLGALARVAPQIFADALRAGPLVRALAFRADLAARVGDTAGARQYASIVVALWSDADPFLQETVERMRRLLR
jgi:hypothetical protein